MVSTSGGKRPSSNDEKYNKIKRSIAEQDPGKKVLMLVEAIVDLLVSNDISHVKMMESIDYLQDEMIKQFDVVRSDLDNVMKHFDAVRSLLDGLGAAIGAVNTRTDIVIKRLQRNEDLITDVHQRIERLEVKSANHDDRFSDMDNKLDEILRLLRN